MSRWDKIEDNKCQSYESEWLFIHPYVLDISEFKNKHPGGRLALEHGRYQDMTDYFITLHPEQTESYLKYYAMGELVNGDIKWQGKCKYSKNEKIAIQKALLVIHSDVEMTKQRQSVVDMHKALLKEGVYETKLSFYVIEVCKLIILASFCIYLLNNECWLSSSFVLGFFWHQLAFIGHDLGHYGVTHTPLDYQLGVFIGDFCGGISIGWWKHSHNIHHIITNDPHHDPDIQHLPFFAVTSEFFNSIYSSFHGRKLKFDGFSRFIVQYQHYLYYFVLMFGRFNLYVQSWVYLSGYLTTDKIKHRKLEIVSMVGFMIWYSMLLSHIPGIWNKLLYTFICHALTALLHVQITLSHFAMDTATPLQETVMHRMLRTTMDVECSSWLDWLHGGLQFQTTHHVFPRLPRHELRHIRIRLQGLAKEMGVDYKSVGFVQGNGMVLKALRFVANLAGGFSPKSGLKSK